MFERPVDRSTEPWGRPDWVSYAFIRREPRSSALSRNTRSPLRECAARSPPRLRMVVSNPDTWCTPALLRLDATQSRASSNSFLIPMSQRVSRLSTSVVPIPPQLDVARWLMGWSSSFPNAYLL